MSEEFVVVNGEKIEVTNGKLLVLLLKNIRRISEIEGLEKLSGLQSLLLSYNQIEEIEGLDTLVNLRELYLDNNRIKEIKGLEKLGELGELRLHNNEISKIEGLSTLVNLYKLYLGSNKITDIEGMDNLVNLEHLAIDFNQISRVRGLDKLTKLNILKIHDNQIPPCLIHHLGGLNDEGYANEPRNLVNYCFKIKIDEEKQGSINNSCPCDNDRSLASDQFITSALPDMSIKEIIDTFSKAINLDTRLCCLEELAKRQDSKAVDFLIQTLTRHQCPEIRMTAVYCLFRFRKREVDDALKKAAKDISPDVRWYAEKARLFITAGNSRTNRE